MLSGKKSVCMLPGKRVSMLWGFSALEKGVLIRVHTLEKGVSMLSGKRNFN